MPQVAVAKLRQVVHIVYAVGGGSLDRVAPNVQLDATDPEGQKVRLNALVLTDPDGEAHVYVYDKTGRDNLIKAITGGVVLPTNGSGPV